MNGNLSLSFSNVDGNSLFGQKLRSFRMIVISFLFLKTFSCAIFYFFSLSPRSDALLIEIIVAMIVYPYSYKLSTTTSTLCVSNLFTFWGQYLQLPVRSSTQANGLITTRVWCYLSLSLPLLTIRFFFFTVRRRAIIIVKYKRQDRIRGGSEDKKY